MPIKAGLAVWIGLAAVSRFFKFTISPTARCWLVIKRDPTNSAKPCAPTLHACRSGWQTGETSLSFRTCQQGLRSAHSLRDRTSHGQAHLIFGSNRVKGIFNEPNQRNVVETHTDNKTLSI